MYVVLKTTQPNAANDNQQNQYCNGDDDTRSKCARWRKCSIYTHVTGKTTHSACDVRSMFVWSAAEMVFALFCILYPTHTVQLQIDELDTEQQKHDISLYNVKRCLLYCSTLVFDDESVSKPNSRPYANNCHSFKLNNNNKQL